MKHIVFISGKGGTGKSTLVSSLSIIVQNKMIADCDVDAPNMHILLKGEVQEKMDYFGAKEAVIDPDLCIKCGICKDTCRFDSINDEFKMIPMKCEGCGACVLACPQKAIHLEEVKTGELYISKTSRGTFSHALLDIGAEGSGKLVTEVRKNIRNVQKDEDWVLIDGSPGIGCVVIASITGADAVVAVSEPTKSGQSDLERVLGVAKHFGIPAFVCINKYDLNSEVTSEIEAYCEKEGVPVIGKIPFDPSIVKALRNFKTPIEDGNENVSNEIENIWKRITDEIKKIENAN
ncbi:ATP-binding protein [Acetivibrio cellulolyticus]|uniref:ATP-binding protein n=1 Tax=Acetivibrio cellulolyticus TaxID=35830 RepID=UPI0001E2CCA6|nr:ATP-binding protein [Acetivibrio cellulolyticus]